MKRTSQPGAQRWRSLTRLAFLSVLVAGGLLVWGFTRPQSALACCDNASTSVSGTPNPATVGTPISIVAHVCITAQNPGEGTYSPAGFVDFWDITNGTPGTSLASQPLVASAAHCSDATYSTSSLPTGTYTFRAVQHGDDNWGEPLNFSSDAYQQVVSCTGGAAICTRLTSAAVTLGAGVQDTATLNNVTGDAGGTVTYNVYSDSSCTNSVFSSQVSVTNGVAPSSSAFTPASTGTYYWQRNLSTLVRQLGGEFRGGSAMAWRAPPRALAAAD